MFIINNVHIKKILGILSFVFIVSFSQISLANDHAAFDSREFIELRVYHFSTAQQENALDVFFKDALLPALHVKGIKKVGVFKAIANDTASDKKIYVLIPFKSFNQHQRISSNLSKNEKYIESGKEYINAVYNKPVYNRLETIFLQAFKSMPSLAAPQLKAPKNERVYELRSYESASEKLFQNKVQMFNEGGEVALFKRLGFNAVFYGEVIAGASMPNLMYMTSFENKKDRDEHWKSFSADPEWKRLSSMKEYQNNVTKIDIHFLKSAEYSDL